jgi:hypothetical protein
MPSFHAGIDNRLVRKNGIPQAIGGAERPQAKSEHHGSRQREQHGSTVHQYRVCSSSRAGHAGSYDPPVFRPFGFSTFA